MTAFAPDELAERLVACARAAGAEAADAMAIRAAERAVSVRDGALESAEASESVDFGLRVLIGARQACVSASDPRPEVLDDLARRAVAMAREAPEDPYCGLLPLAQTGAAPDDLALEDPAPPASARQLQALAHEAERAALSAPGVSVCDAASASLRRTTLALAASSGFSGCYARHSSSLSCAAIAGAGVEMESDYAWESRRRLADLPPAAEIGALAGRRAAARLGARKAPTGPAPVIFDRRVSGSLIGHLLSAANGAAIASGRSWLMARMDTQVLPGWASLIEEPLRPGAPMSRPFDAEGAPGRTSPIVENGVLRRWLLDAASARQLNLRSTGNARRGLSAPPAPGAGNIALSPGSLDRAALIAQMGTGLLVTSMMGSSVNPTTGAYSRGAAGFWIEGGEIAYPVSEATIAGALPDMLLSLRAANDADPHVAMRAPSLRVDGLVIG